jgi:hypothetical protein
VHVQASVHNTTIYEITGEKFLFVHAWLCTYINTYVRTYINTGAHTRAQMHTCKSLKCINSALLQLTCCTGMQVMLYDNMICRSYEEINSITVG